MAIVRTEGGYDLWFETCGRKGRPTIVLLHGFTGTHSTWRALSRVLAPDFFIVAPDLPGHCNSGMSRSIEKMSLEATCAGLLSMLDYLGVDKTALLGYSLGGRIALRFACKHQERLSCLVLESASPGIQDATEREKRMKEDDLLADQIEEKGVEWFVDYWQSIPLFATQRELPARTFNRIRGQRLSNTADGLSMSLRGAGTGRMTPLWSSLTGLKIPVLLVAGKKDERYTTLAESMRQLIPRSSMTVIGDAGHCVHLERADAFADTVLPFLGMHSES